MVKKQRLAEPGSAEGPSSVSGFLLSATTETDSKEKAGLADRFSKLFAAGDSSGGFLGSLGASSSTSTAKSSSSTSKAQIEKPEKSDQKGSSADADATKSESKASKKRKLNDEELKERETRTLFVGNVPLRWDEKNLRKAMRDAVGDKYTGQMKPIWFRAIPLSGKWNWSDKMRKAGSIQKAFDDETADSKNAYVVLGAVEDVPVVAKAVNNFQADQTHNLRADGVGSAAVMKKFDRKRSVFLGNLPPRVTEAEIRDVMSPAGTVDAVRIVRDKLSKECQGFAFVRFDERSSVKEALNLWEATVQGRWIRIMKVQDDADGKGSGKGKDSEGLFHPATRRKQLRQASRQRSKDTKKKQFAKNARDAGLRTGRTKGKKASKGAKGKKAGKKK